MTTRIRQIRKQRGLTLQVLADKIGTTPQTIQRLETNNMTISIEWLERIGQALRIPAAMLLDSYSAPTVPLIGELGTDGAIKRLADKSKSIEIAIKADDPIAVSLRERFGPHDPGTILIGARVPLDRSKDVDGRDCLVELKGGRLVFRRIVHGKNSITAFVPYEDGSNVERNLDIVWLAPIVMAVRFLPS